MKWKSFALFREGLEGRATETNEKLFILQSHLSNLLSRCPFEEAQKKGARKPRSWNDKFYAKFLCRFSACVVEEHGNEKKNATNDGWKRGQISTMMSSGCSESQRADGASLAITFGTTNFSPRLDFSSLSQVKIFFVCSFANICQLALFAASIQRSPDGEKENKKQADVELTRIRAILKNGNGISSETIWRELLWIDPQ